MREQLQRLIGVQRLDIRILELEEKGKQIPLKIQALQQEFESKKKAHIIKEQEFETLEKDLRSKERKLETTNDNLKKYQNQIYRVKTQKEAEALDHEITKAKTEIDRLEDKILNLMEETEVLRKKIQQNEEVIDKEAEELNEKEKKYQEELEVVTRKLDSAKKMRAGFVPNIEGKLLSLYDKLRQKKENIAIVTVKGGTCGGCFMNLPPQLINEIKVSASPVRCENCLRILYWEEE